MKKRETNYLLYRESMLLRIDKQQLANDTLEDNSKRLLRVGVIPKREVILNIGGTTFNNTY